VTTRCAPLWDSRDLTRAFGVAAAIGRDTIIFLLFGEAAA